MKFSEFQNNNFRECRDCKAPKRHIGCHADCEDYRKSLEAYRAATAALKTEADLYVMESATDRINKATITRKRGFIKK